jgi:hypothetical protein
MSFRVAISAAVLLAASVGMARAGDGLGRVPPSYIAADNDLRLMAIAREAVPLIAAIDTFYKSHGACPQPSLDDQLAEFRAHLTDGYAAERHGRFVMLRQPQVIPGWIYDTFETRPGACSLWRKLGWDPALIWRRAGNETGTPATAATSGRSASTSTPPLAEPVFRAKPSEKIHHV